MSIFAAVLGFFAFIGIGYALSNNRKAINWRTILWAIGLQIVFAIIVLKTKPGIWLFDKLNDFIVSILNFQAAGGEMIFGELSKGYIFAFAILPTIIFFSALMSLLYYLGIMQKIVWVFAWVMRKTCRLSGAESLSAAANIFVGQTEAPLLIKPYVEKMTKSELMCVMTGGMATVAGGVMAAYILLLKDTVPGIAGHLMAASVMGAPAAVLFAKLMVPETKTPDTLKDAAIDYKDPAGSVLESISNGTATGLQLALNVAAMLISFTALIALANGGLEWITSWGIFQNLFGWLDKIGLMPSIMWQDGISFQELFGVLFAPLAWLMGVPLKEIITAGQFVGEKTILNEFVAYANFANFLNDGGEMTLKTKVILSYALCGFANFASVGIQIGGIGAIAPSRKKDLAALGFKAMIAGLLASCFRAVVAGLLIG